MYLIVGMRDSLRSPLAIAIGIDKDNFRLQQSFLGLLNKESYTSTNKIERIELQGIKELKNKKKYTVDSMCSNIALI